MGVSEKFTQQCTEAWPMARMWYYAQRAKVLPKDENLAFCYNVLNNVSRSFAVVIQQLPADLRDSVCIFYLVLRALDTVEDDMSIPVPLKLGVLRNFHEKIYVRDWTMECGTGEYQKLMQQYPKVTDVFMKLPEGHKEVIREITQRMGEGMAEFIEKDVDTVKDYDLYCHYVAGLVGIGLSKLFAASGLEDKEFGTKEDLSNHMGLFLQKTNIIRDYLEDIMEEPAPRMFWPKEIWGLYAEKLEDFKESKNASMAVQALNHMVTDALRHAPYCLKYMEGLRDKQIFRFCAIPQVMAIATLAEIYSNPKVFTGVVKVRRGIVAQYMMGLNDQAALLRAFSKFATKILLKSDSEAHSDPISTKTVKLAQAVVDQSLSDLQRSGQPVIASTDWPALLIRLSLLIAATSYVVSRTVQAHPIGATIVHLISTLPLVLVLALIIYSSTQRV